MGRYDQAPKLVNKKPKMDNNIIMFTNEMYCNIMKQIGSKYRAGHVLIWLMGQADGFGVAEKTVANAIGISTSAYHQDIRFLDDLGLITHVSGKNIIINYDKILGDHFEQSKNRVFNLDSLNQSEDNKNRVIESDSLFEGVKIDQSILGDQINQSILEKIEGDQFNQSKGVQINHPKGVQIDQYNIEKHIKTYKESQEKLGCEKRDSILGNEKRDPILTIENFKTGVYQNSYLDEYNATGKEILDSYDFTNDGEIEEMSNEFPEAYSDLVKLGIVKRKEWVF